MAASDVIKQFLVSLGYQVDKSSEKKFTTGIAEATKRVGLFAAGVQVMAGVVWASVLRTANSLDNLSDISGRVNVPVDKLEELGYIASQTDSSVEAVHASLESLNSVIGQAALGVGRGAMMFKKLGLQAKNTDGSVKGTAQVLEEIGAKIKDMSKGEQIAFLQRVGVDRTMVQMLTGDVSHLREEFHKMYDTVGVDANEAAQTASDFMDEWGKLGTISSMLYRAINIGFMKKFKDDLTRLRKMIIENADKIKRIVTSIMSFVMRLAGAIGAAAIRIIKWIQKITDWYAKLDDKNKNLIMTVGALIAAWKLLNLQFLTTPLGMLIAALTGLFLIVDDLLTYLEGGRSAIDWGPWLPQIEAVINIFKKLKEIMAPIFGKYGAQIKDFALAFIGLNVGPHLLSKLFMNLASSITPFAKLFGLFKGNIRTVRKVFSALGMLSGGFAKLTGTIGSKAIPFIGKFGSAILHFGGIMGGKIISGISAFGTALVNLGSSIVTKVIPAVIKFTAALWANPVTWIVAGVLLLVAALYLLYKNWDKVKAAVSDFVKKTVKWFKELPGKIGSAISGIVEKIKSWFKSAKNWAVEKFAPIIDWFRDLPGKIGRALMGLVDIIKEPFIDAYNYVTGLWNDFWGITEKTPEEQEAADLKALRQQYIHTDFSMETPISTFDQAGFERAEAEYYANKKQPAGREPATPGGKANEVYEMGRYTNKPSPSEQAGLAPNVNSTQTNNIKSENTFNIQTDKPNEAADAVASKSDTIARNTVSAIKPMQNSYNNYF